MCVRLHGVNEVCCRIETENDFVAKLPDEEEPPVPHDCQMGLPFRGTFVPIAGVEAYLGFEERTHGSWFQKYDEPVRLHHTYRFLDGTHHSVQRHVMQRERKYDDIKT